MTLTVSVDIRAMAADWRAQLLKNSDGLRVSPDDLPSLDDSKAFAAALADNPSTNTFHLFNFDSLAPLLDEMKANSNVRDLRFIRNVFDDDAGRACGSLIERWPLERLEFLVNPIPPPAFLPLAAAIRRTTTIRLLQFEESELDVDTVRCLAEAVAENSSLRSLIIVRNRLSSECLTLLFGGLRSAPFLTELCFDGCDFLPDKIATIASEIKSNEFITKFHLLHNYIFGVNLVVVDALRFNTTITDVAVPLVSDEWQIASQTLSQSIYLQSVIFNPESREPTPAPFQASTAYTCRFNSEWIDSHIDRQRMWQQLGLLTRFFLANAAHPLLHSIHPIVPLVVDLIGKEGERAPDIVLNTAGLVDLASSLAALEPKSKTR